MKKLLYLTAFLLTGIPTVYGQHISTTTSQTAGDIYHLGGNLGIGGTPVSKLDIGNFQNGSISNQVVFRLRNTVAENQAANWGSAIEFYNMSNNITNSILEGAKIISEASHYGWSHNLKFRVFQNNNFQNQIGIDAMTINTNGNVGIGTSDPKQRLHVSAGIKSNSLYIGSGNNFSDRSGNGDNIYIRQPIQTSGGWSGVTAEIDNIASHTASFYPYRYIQAVSAGGGTYFYIDKNGGGYFAGNVGIGGTPVSKLDVGNFQNGSISNQVVLRLRNTIAENQPANWGSAIEFYNMSNNITNSSLQGAKIISEASQYGWSHNLKFRVFQNNNFQNQTGIDAMTINTNGNVGIGTTTPDAKLAVNGTVHAKEVKVDLNGWPDFVFNKDYPLPTLEEVETHIKENGHLKDIPSEAEVKANGINLGEMDAKLLQKIEELMLYTIEQDKTLKQQQEFMEAQQKQLQLLQEEVHKLKHPKN